MPAKSQAQRAYIYATKGKKWAKAHGFDNPGKLPARVKRKGKLKVKKKAKAKPRKRKKAKKKGRPRRSMY